MYSPDKMNRKPLGARIEDELMKYILQERVGGGVKDAQKAVRRDGTAVPKQPQSYQ